VPVAQAIATSPSDLRIATVSLAGVAIVKTDPQVLSEFAPAAGSVERLDDAGLQQALREAGEPAGIVRIGKRVLVEGDIVHRVGL
jgi:hypothetical protein